jgi:lysophospholipase L1-like esterase
MHSKNQILSSCLVVMSMLLIASCKPSFEEPRVSSGEADFSRYVSVGGNLASGYQDGALFGDGQRTSVANILSSSFKTAGGEEFVQPLIIGANGVGLNFKGEIVGKLKLFYGENCKGVSAYYTQHQSSLASDLEWIGSQGPFNDYGIPGAKSFSLYSQFYGRKSPIGNAFYHRFASDTGNVGGQSSTVLGDASKRNPTFFTLWVGVNDMMGYALSGGSGLTSGLGDNDITPLDTFQYAIDFAINRMSGNGAKGLIANIPSIEDIPFFTTIPYNGLILTQAEANALNLISPAGINFVAGANPFVIQGSTIRQLVPGELVLLSAKDSITCFGLGTTTNALPDNFVLDSSEVSAIKDAISNFNSKIQSVAIAKNLAFADMNTFYKSMSNGLVFNGVSLSSSYLSNSTFSIDGIHPNSKGFGLIANYWIDVINAKFKSTLNKVDVNMYSGIKFP